MLSWVLFVVRAGMAKTLKVQCTSLKVLTQTPTLATCLKLSIFGDDKHLHARKMKMFGSFMVKLHVYCIYLYAISFTDSFIFHSEGDMPLQIIDDFLTACPCSRLLLNLHAGTLSVFWQNLNIPLEQRIKVVLIC